MGLAKNRWTKGASAAKLAERQEPDLSIPFPLNAALNEYNKFLDRLRDSDALVHLEDAGHWKGPEYPLDNEWFDSRYVVSQQNATLGCAPIEQLGVTLP